MVYPFLSSRSAPTPTTGLALGQEIIAREAAALNSLAGSLGESFVEAVRLILASEGRLLVSGMGKSGLICRKIAATFSATGTPAFFLHPAEAGHGDLGSLQPGDCLLVLSNSGATRELRPLIAYARQIEVPIIAIASIAESELVRQATLGLILPDEPEACPQRIAPTTSTTMMLALGDALALVLMEHRGITREDLIRWHPGGRIGWEATTLIGLIETDVALPLVHPDADVRQILGEITRFGKGIVGVVDPDGGLIGVVTDGDLRRAFDHVLTARAVDIMTNHPKTIEASATVGDARRHMEQEKIMALFVVPDRSTTRPIGLIHLHDLAQTQ